MHGHDILSCRINLLFYIDDLKTFHICAKATFRKGRLVKTADIKLDLDTTIQELEVEKSYKNPGVNEGDGIQKFDDEKNNHHPCCPCSNRGNLQKHHNDKCIEELDQEGVYKYLGINAGDGTYCATFVVFAHASLIS